MNRNDAYMATSQLSATVRTRSTKRTHHESARKTTGNSPGPSSFATGPEVTVGIRFHDPNQTPLLERCLISVGAQSSVAVEVIVALQEFNKTQVTEVEALATRALSGSGFGCTVLNVPNPKKMDLRSVLLNRIVDTHYRRCNKDYLVFIDYDDIWFQHALETLVEPLILGEFALSYADIHCADVYYDSGQTYLRGVKDLYQISQKTKRNLLRGNFLPLHSYMFHTGRIDRTVLHYDEELTRLEDYDVLLSVCRDHAVSGLHRKRLIGLYNFYTLRAGHSNTTCNVFRAAPQETLDEKWADATRTIISRHAGKSWHDFWGEEWCI